MNTRRWDIKEVFAKVVSRERQVIRLHYRVDIYI
jgi:hypothetical protein